MSGRTTARATNGPRSKQPWRCSKTTSKHTPNGDLRRTAFGLRTGVLREPGLASKRATVDHAPMTAHHVDRLASPALDRTVAEREIHHPGQLDTIKIPRRAHVGNVNLLQQQMVRRCVETAPVVDVDPVGPLAPRGQVPQDQVRTIAQLPSRCAVPCKLATNTPD